jgi:lipopolysaccharide transport system ATP-binding protein
MSDTIIKVQGLGKRYFIGHEKHGSYTAMRDVISNNVKGFGRDIQRMFRNDVSSGIGGDEIEDFWALKDIDFEIKKGDAIGIVGRNGAGKSTLLKVLSRITEPTKGRVEIKGRLASLLEVGTGFHPELSGRENIFLNGAILGMSRTEIKSKFDEIVDFSGVEKFLDTPVKRYSSGMYVRLAFAVAAHLESEILIVDEVLAVGDAEFQKKCLGKMGDVTKSEGRTVLFVSHNLMAMKQLCNKGILLDGGVKTFEGEVNKVIDQYSRPYLKEKQGFKAFKINDLSLTVINISINPEEEGQVTPFKPLRIDIEIEAEREVKNIGIQIMLSHEDTNGFVFFTNTKTTSNIDVILKKGYNKVTFILESFDLCSGNYWLGFIIDLPFVKLHFANFQLLSFNVPEVVHTPRLLPTNSAYGHVYLKHKWILNK